MLISSISFYRFKHSSHIKSKKTYCFVIGQASHQWHIILAIILENLSYK